MAAADFDNDGYVDLFVTTNRSGNVLLHNDNGRGFSDVTQSAGVAGTGSDPSMSAAWGDFDSDGWADLYVTNYGCQPCRRASDGRVTYQLEDGARSDGVADRLYRNRGDGTFEDLTAALGGIPETLGFGFQASWSDLDLDGDSDLYLVNDVRDTAGLYGNVLIRNDGPGCTSWCFTGLSAVSGSAIRINGMGLAIGDIDNDGDPDLYMSNTGLAEHPQLPVLLRNEGGLRFTDVSATAGAQLLEMTWGADFADLNGDGWLDLLVASAMSAGAERGKCTAAVLSPLVPTVALSEIETFCASPAFTNNAVLLGGPGKRFTRQPLAYGGADGADTLSIVAVDVDGDRRPDVSGANLVTPPGIFRNTDGREPTIAVDVKHAGQHRTALGTRIEVRVPARPELGVQSRELRSGSSLGASVGGSAVFGLNGASEAQVDVLFADGTRLSRTLRPGDFWDVSR